MDIVVDTSVLIAVIANEPEKAALVEATTGVDLIAPHSVHWEIGNAFSAMLRRDRITLAQAVQAVQAYRKIPIRFMEVELQDTLKIADAMGVYAYDAYLIRCALRYKAPVVSLDRGLLRAARAMGADVIEVIP